MPCWHTRKYVRELQVQHSFRRLSSIHFIPCAHCFAARAGLEHRTHHLAQEYDAICRKEWAQRSMRGHGYGFDSKHIRTLYKFLVRR